MELKNKQCPFCGSHNTIDWWMWVGIIWLWAVLSFIWFFFIPLLLIWLLVMVIWIISVVKDQATSWKKYTCKECKKVFTILD